MVRSNMKRKGRAGMPKAMLAILVLGLVPLFFSGRAAEAAGAAFPLQVTVGQSLVLEMPREVTTVSIADPRIADAAVGSQKTVVVNGKAVGTTSLVVWEEGGTYTLYQVVCGDAGVRNQVLLRCKVAEIDNSKLDQLGTDWTAFVNSVQHLDGSIAGGLFMGKIAAPTAVVGPSGATDGFLKYTKSNGDVQFATIFQAMEQNGIAKTLANPNLVALSGDSASFLSGGEIPVPIAQSSGGVGVNGAFAGAITIEWKQFGVRLLFIPTVLDSQRIRLYVEPEVSALDYNHSVILSGTVVPGVTTRRVTTTVEMKSGEVLIIGGVKSNEDVKTVRKFPILGDIPIINLFFKHTSHTIESRDLVMAVSPEILGALGKTWPSPMPGEANYVPTPIPQGNPAPKGGK
jgi:pilus assembly protein CpaC